MLPVSRPSTGPRTASRPADGCPQQRRERVRPTLLRPGDATRVPACECEPARAARCRSKLGEAPLEERSFRTARCQRECALVCCARLLSFAQAPQQIGTRGMEEVVILERQTLDEVEPALRAVCHRNRDGAVELDDR